MNLTIHFTETFQGETILIRFGELETLTVANLQTDPRTGLARSIDVPTQSGPIVLHASLQQRGQTASLAIDTASLQYLTVEWNGEKLRLMPVSKADYIAEPRGFA